MERWVDKCLPNFSLRLLKIIVLNFTSDFYLIWEVKFLKELKNIDKPLEHDFEFEKCVICHKQTEYRVQQPISQRKFYVEGCGQLCEKCYRELKIGEK